jgi:hypothetical protein
MKVTLALAFILILNLFLWFGQTGVNEIAASEGVVGTTFYNYEGSLIKSYDTGNYTLNEDVSGELPSGQGSIEPESGNFFTDTFSTIKNWFLETTGLSYLVGIVSAFPNALKSMGLPPVMAFGLGFFWHALTIFLIVAFIKGNQ